jgi:hypothetical protein
MLLLLTVTRLDGCSIVWLVGKLVVQSSNVYYECAVCQNAG